MTKKRPTVTNTYHHRSVFFCSETVLFLTDSVFHVLFAYFDESMASKIVYKP